jgi:uncharacterized protein (TIGR02246 family)
VSEALSADEIRQVAQEMADASARGDVEAMASFFRDDGVIYVAGQVLSGTDGVRHAIRWMLDTLGPVRYEHILSAVEGNTLAMEARLTSRTPEGKEFTTRAAQVLIFRGTKVASMRLYIDRLDVAQQLAPGPVQRSIADRIHRETLKGLV